MPNTIFSIAILVSIATAWVYGIATLLLTYRNRRYWRSHQRQAPPILMSYPRACLIIPCKGMEHRLRENLTAYVQQDHPNFELQFVVENDNDPSVNLIRNIMRENRHVTSRLVVSGRSTTCGQKVHNLRCATDQLAPEVEVLVFADSNTCPQRSWLKWLVAGIEKEKVGAKTGYRWMIPRDKKTATMLGCTINNAFASLFGRATKFLVWGGSWAIHREVFDAVGIREAWDGVLSDDLVASRVLFDSGLRVKFEPQCVCISHVKFTTASLLGYLRRQFVVARRYTSTYWLTGLLIGLLTQTGYWSGFVLGCVALWQGSMIGFWLLASTMLLYILHAAKALIRQNMGRMVTSEWRKYRRARKFDIVAGPLTGLYATLVMLGSAFGNRISCRGIRYHISRGGRILLFSRQMTINPWPIIHRQRPNVQLDRDVESQFVPVINKRAA